MKTLWVKFDQYGGRVIKGGPRPEGEQVLENPELPWGIPPHRWYLKDGKIEVLPKEDQQVTDISEALHKREVYNQRKPKKDEEVKVLESLKQKYVKPKWRHYLETAVIALVVSGALKYFLK